MNEMDIRPWLIRMSQGDEEAFQEVYDLARDQAYGLIYYLAPNKHDVPDIMSEVYIELFKKDRVSLLSDRLELGPLF